MLGANSTSCAACACFTAGFVRIETAGQGLFEAKCDQAVRSVDFTRRIMSSFVPETWNRWTNLAATI